MKILLFSPFERYSENKLLLIGVIITLLGSFLAYQFNIRFDGVLDLHLVEELSVGQSFIDNLVNLSSLIILLFILSRIINAKSRLVDIVATVLIARIPYYFLTLFNINNALKDSTNEIMQLANAEILNISIFSSIFMVVFSLFSVLAIIWSVALLFNGFKITANAKGIKSTLLFIVFILLAEVLSKFLINII
jgi:hypothetical protein